jgi:hypothetical protein
MTKRSIFLRSFALAMALSSTAPALACSSSMATEVHGDDNDFDSRARDCAELGVYAKGNDNVVEGVVSGPGTQAVSGSLGDGNRTDFDVAGADNQIGIEVRDGSEIATVVRGDDNEIAERAGNNSVVSTQVTGHGNYVRNSAR